MAGGVNCPWPSTCRCTSSCRPGSWPTSGTVLADTDTDPSMVTLEVTESVLIKDFERVLEVLAELKNSA